MIDIVLIVNYEIYIAFKATINIKKRAGMSLSSFRSANSQRIARFNTETSWI